MKKEQTRFVVVSGGVISGVGKGVATASIGKILQEHGYKVTIIKIDPYINVDAGTLRPTEHGEVWVTHDGGEIDQDLGTYERFLNIDIPKKNNITTGQIYKSVIEKERQGYYKGQTVQFIPHIINEIIERIELAASEYDIAIIEIGGTVGDHENVPFLFALKAIERERGADFVSYILVTYLPVPAHIQEMKTKPTQQAIRMLGEQGILPDFIICRSDQAIDVVRKKKIEEFAHIASDRIIGAPNVSSVYEIPLLFEEQQLGNKLLDQFHLPSLKKPEWNEWKSKVQFLSHKAEAAVKIGIVGKYLEIGDYSLTDSYLSIYHALQHAAAQLKISISIEWLNAQDFEQNNIPTDVLNSINAFIVPGGFGSVGIEGKIKAINFARTNNIPYLGICYGMHLAIVEFARNVAGLQHAHTTEVDPHSPYPVISLLHEQEALLQAKKLGGSMRLGAYKCVIKPDSQIHQLYQQAGHGEYIDNNFVIYERHRHRYEVNGTFVPLLSNLGLTFSGFYEQDGLQLMEFIEYNQHPFFIATQAHPEFRSRFDNPNPLFTGLLTAAADKS